MNIKTLIQNTDVISVLDIIKCHYGDKEIKQIMSLYEKLRLKNPTASDKNETLFITAVIPREEDDDTVLDTFDEYDPNVYFDVSLEVKGEDILYSIASSRHRDYLSFNVSHQTLEKMSPASILAHSLWELTSYSYDDH